LLLTAVRPLRLPVKTANFRQSIDSELPALLKSWLGARSEVTMVVRKVSARFKTPLGFEEWDVV